MNKDRYLKKIADELHAIKKELQKINERSIELTEEEIAKIRPEVSN